MANTCFTTYRIYKSANSNASVEFFNVLEKLSKDDPCNIIHVIQILKYFKIPVEGIDCRGEITNFYWEDDALVFCCESSWAELEDWRHAIETQLETKIYYISEEPGEGVFIYNDPTKNIYRVEYNIPEADAEKLDREACAELEFSDIQSVFDFVQKISGFTYNKDNHLTENQMLCYAALLAEQRITLLTENNNNDDNYYISLIKYNFLEN